MEVNAFVQDTLGYVWIGTSHGLARFNGSGYMTLKATAEEGGLSNDNVMSMMYDGGTLWLGTECGIGYLDEGVYTHNGEAVYNPISAIRDMGDGHILALGKDGLVKMEKDGLKATAVHYALGTSWLEHVLVTSSGDVWYASSSNDSTYLYILDSGLNERHKAYLGRNLDISGICELSSGDIYLASGSWVSVHDSESGVVSAVDDLNRILGKDDRIHFMLPYRGDQLLLGIKGRGFFAYVPSDGTVRHIIRQQTLSAQKYVCFIDRDDRIWLSDRQSPVRTYNPKGVYIHFNPQGEDTQGEVSHLSFDKDGYLWQNISGRLCSMDSVTGEIVSVVEEDESCRNVFIDSSGRLWAIFGQNDVRRYLTEGGKAVIERSFSFNEGVFSISEGQDGKIWLSSVRRLFVIDQRGTVSEVVPDGAPAFTLLLSDLRTRRIFMFTVNDGLYELKEDSSVCRIDTGDVKGISYVMTASDGALWIGTYNEGIIRYDESSGTIMKTGSQEGLSDLSVRTIVEDSNGDIWFSTRSDIVRYESGTGDLTTVHDDWYVEGRSYSLVSGACGPDGMLFFGGTAGITRVNPFIPFPEAEEKVFGLEQVTIGGRSVGSFDDGLSLGPEDGMLALQFAGLDYDSGPFLTYSYLMEGYDRNWTYVYGNGLAVYSHLPAGRYVFRARMKGFDGEWVANEISLPVTVRRASGTVAVVIVLIVIGLAALVSLHLVMRSRRAVVTESDSVGEERQEADDWFDPSSFNEADKAFIAKLKALIEDNLDSEKFTVNDLAKDMGMSYSSLYSKVKTITGGTPQYFVSAYRMRKAEKFLKSGAFSVSEVAYKVGSSSPMTFSREFKKFFGFPPSTLLKGQQ